MAKKKSETAEGAEQAPKKSKSAGRKQAAPEAVKPVAEASKSAAPASKPAAPPVPKPVVPMADIKLAAGLAARMLAAKARLAEAAQPAKQEQPAKESGAFKQLKESLDHPAAHTVSNTMGNAFGAQKPNLPPMYGRNQTAHNQVQGGVGRVNVPRRTAG